MARREGSGKVDFTVIARSDSDEAIQLASLTLDCFACARNDGENAIACRRNSPMLANGSGEEF